MLTRNFFNNSSRRMALSTLVDPSPISLKVHVWHAGRVSSDQSNFIRMPQKEALLNINPSPDLSKISHASCELSINFQHPDIKPNLLSKAKSLLIKSDEYLLSQDGNLLSIDTRREILSKYENSDIKFLNAYLSWYPGNIDAHQRFLKSIPKENLAILRQGSFSNNQAVEWLGYIFSKSFPHLRERNELDDDHRNRETITLREIDAEAILCDLSRFIVFGFDENTGAMTVLKANHESRYFLYDLFSDHVSRDTLSDFKPEHACSSLVARILRNALGDMNYAQFVDAAKVRLGHAYAYPELIYEVTKLAESFEARQNEPVLR